MREVKTSYDSQNWAVPWSMSEVALSREKNTEKKMLQRKWHWKKQIGVEKQECQQNGEVLKLDLKYLCVYLLTQQT